VSPQRDGSISIPTSALADWSRWAASFSLGCKEHVAAVRSMYRGVAEGAGLIFIRLVMK
jgi:hypothetical protein